MNCPFCETEMGSNAGVYHCMNCRLIINTLNMSRINQEKLIYKFEVEK